MSKPTNSPTVEVLGVEIDKLTIAEAISLIVQEAPKSPARYIAKPYVEFMVLAQKNPGVLGLLKDAWLCLPDGISLNWAAYYQQLPKKNPWTLFKSLSEIVLNPAKVKSVIPENFSGINFTLPLLEAASEKGLSVFLVGSPINSSIEKTALFLKNKYPKLNICGTYPGFLNDQSYVGLEGNIKPEVLESLTQELTQANADIVLIGMGFPRQEYLARELTKRLKHGILIGEGGSFDYKELGGIRKKAPKIIQKLHLEWLWRLILEPKRIKRQLTIPHFIWLIYKK